MPDTPFHEDEARLPYPNFYYAQEDELFAAAERDGFTWSVHRAHTVIGYAVGNAMNMGQTLAVAGGPLPGAGTAVRVPRLRDPVERLTDMTDAGMLAEQMHWAATTPAAAQPGLQHRQRRRLPLALDVAAARRAPRRRARGLRRAPRPLEEQMAGAGAGVDRAGRARQGCASTTSTASPRGGTPTATSAATSSASPT